MSDAAPRHALLLTAGLGTRLRPLTLVRAKPSIPVAGEPIVRRIVRWLVANGVSDVTLNLHYLPHTISRVVGDGSDLKVRIRYSWEQPRILGSAGGPRKALDIIGAEQFLLVNGDTLTDVDLRALARSHASTGALVTLALVPNTEPARYGGVTLAPDGRVVGFVPRGAAAAGSFHFIGAQLVNRSVFADLKPDEPVNSIGGCYNVLLERQPGSIRGFVSNASFWDIGTVADYWHTSRAWSTDGTLQSSSRVHSATVTNSILWDDIEVGGGAKLNECIVTDGVVVAPGSTYDRKILMRAPDGTTSTAPLDLHQP